MFRDIDCITRSNFPTLIVDFYEILCIVNLYRDMNNCIWFSVRLLKILGIIETENKWGFEWLKIFIFTLLMFTLFMSGIIELTYSTNEFSQFNYVLSSVFLGAMGLSKYTTLVYYRKRITDLKNDINDDNINDDKSVNDETIIERYDRDGFNVSKIVTFVIMCVGIGMSFQNVPDLLRGGRRLSIDLPHTFSFNSTGFFAVAYVHQLMSLNTFVLTFIATDAWAIFLTYHACGHFTVLQNYLERIAEDEDWGGNQPMDTSERIAKCVRLHQNVCKMTEDLEDFFTIPNFIHFLFSAVGICASAYELSAGNVGAEKLVQHAAVISGQSARLLMVNWCGQLIQDKSFGVSLAICRSEFYKLSACHQKDVALVLLRAQKPVYLTAGKFYNLSLESMTNILRGSVSCFAMFANIDQQLEIP